MSYIPNYNQNKVQNLNDYHFSLWELVNQILAYYEDLDSNSENYIEEMQKGAVFFGYSEQNLAKLANKNQIEWLLTIQYDITNLTNTINHSKQGLSLVEFAVLPYQFSIRCLPSQFLENKSQADPKFRIETILNRLEKDLCNSDFKLEKIPNTIDYEGVVQSNLSNKTVSIHCESNKCLNDRFLENEAINNRQFVVGGDTFQIHFKKS